MAMNFEVSMAMNFKILAVCLLAISPCITAVPKNIVVTKFGVRGNDITEALQAAWAKACESRVPTKIVIPLGIFTLNEINLYGPCKKRIQFRIDGILKAPENPKFFKVKGAWITFKFLDRLSVFGRGTLDGQGAMAWAQCIKSTCSNLPVIMRFSRVTNGRVKGITLTNSKHFHMCVNDCDHLAITKVKIIAPEDSPNTDGIHIGHSSNITITNSLIATGDDCISMIHGNKRVNINGIRCGPGHGISIGSLGKFPHEGPVDSIFVRNCTFTSTNNGVRVKTMPNNRVGTANNIRFENLVMNNVTNPIIIDQTYCGDDHCPEGSPSNIKISNLSIKNIRGTSANPMAVKMACSQKNPCQNVAIGDIDLTYHGPRGKAKSLCTHVKPKIFGFQNPPLCVA